jgi:hypothetical protein
MKNNRYVKAKYIIELAMKNSKYIKKQSKVNKKWCRFLKNNGLFDEYMIYLASFHAVGVEPHTYKQLSNICYNLSNGTSDYIVYGERTIIVDWIEQFKSFAWDSIKWYDLKNIGLYLINRGYL